MAGVVVAPAGTQDAPWMLDARGLSYRSRRRWSRKPGGAVEHEPFRCRPASVPRSCGGGRPTTARRRSEAKINPERLPEPPPLPMAAELPVPKP